MSALCRACGAYWDCEHARAGRFAVDGEIPPPPGHAYVSPYGQKLGDTHAPDPETGLPVDKGWAACDDMGRVTKSGHGSAVFGGAPIVYAPDTPVSVVIDRILAKFSTANADMLSTPDSQKSGQLQNPLDAPEAGA